MIIRSQSRHDGLARLFGGVATALVALSTLALASGKSVSVAVPSPVTNDPVTTGITVTGGRTYVIRANITIVPKVYVQQSIIDPFSVVRADGGGLPLATLDGTPIVDSIPYSSFTPTMDVALTYVPAESGGLYLRLLAIPSAITFNSITIDLPAAPPVVAVKTKKVQPGSKFLIKGTASGDERIARVSVSVNGKVLKAAGTSSWAAVVKLKRGRNKVVVTAFDIAGQASKPVTISVVAK